MRNEDWPEKLHALLDLRKDTVFAWGSHDCCLFAADASVAMGGPDFAAEYRGRYSTALGAMRLVEGRGGLEMAIEKALEAAGQTECRVAYAGRGDVVLFDTDTGPALGVCDGVNSVFAAPDGLTRVPTHKCRRAWKIS